MLKHIVMWKFKDFAEGAMKIQNLHRAEAMFESLPAEISQIKKLEIGIDVLHTGTSYDLVLLCEFDDREALSQYQNHRRHMEIVEFLGKVQTAKVVVDYEIPA